MDCGLAIIDPSGQQCPLGHIQRRRPPPHQVVHLAEPVPTSGTSDRSSAWGRTETISIGQQIEMARVYLEKSEPLMVSVDVISPPVQAVYSGLPGPLTLFTWCKVTFGNGAVSVSRLILCADRADVPLPPATFVQCEVFLGDKDGNLFTGAGDGNLTNNPQAQLTVQLGRGNRGLPYNNTRRVTMQAIGHGIMIDIPVEIFGLHAHLSAAPTAQRFLQLFDQATDVAAGNTPVEEWVIGGPTTIGSDVIDRWTSPLAFQQGLAAALSSTSGSYTAVTDEFWIAVDQLNL